MKTEILILALLLTFSFSCEKEKELIDITGECEFYNNIFSTCFYGIAFSERDEIVFRDNDSYQEFGNTIRFYPANLNCDTARLPLIDFAKHSLLSIKTSGGGCSAIYQRKVWKDTRNKIITYEVSVEYEGNCRLLLGSRNWAIIPKISDDYTVYFVLK